MEPTTQTRLLDILRTTRSLLDYYDVVDDAPAKTIAELKDCMQHAIDQLAEIELLKSDEHAESFSQVDAPK